MTAPRFELRFKAKGKVQVRFRASRVEADQHRAFLERHGYSVKMKELQR